MKRAIALGLGCICLAGCGGGGAGDDGDLAAPAPGYGSLDDPLLVTVDCDPTLDPDCGSVPACGACNGGYTWDTHLLNYDLHGAQVAPERKFALREASGTLLYSCTFTEHSPGLLPHSFGCDGVPTINPSS